MNYAELSKKVEEHVISYFNSRENPQLTYHNLDHTLSVVKAAKQIAGDYQLSDKEHFIVTAAACFHDIGYLKGAEKHEEKGAKMAHVFLHKSGVDSESIQTITECILATTLPQNPKTTLEEIVCDADLSHLGSDDFWEKSKLLRKEMENREARFISKDEWRKSTTDFLINHHYFTNYGESVLAKKKKENLEKLQQNEVKKNKKSDENKTAEPEKSVSPKKKEERSSRSNKGVETMFRISSSNNQRLSDMADNKAHILISVNSIILSAIISLVLHKLDEYRYLAWPTYLILSVSVFTIIYSILATRPTISKGTFSKDEVEEKKVNLLFFGNYYKMSLDDYSHSMQQVMSDTVFTYKTLVQDVYFQGIVLGRKYKLLRKGYNIFMFGLIASVIAFVVASMLEGR